jgi:hypothetical protein
MRIIGEIPHPSFKITLYAWNNRYLIKLERDKLEQTFKVEQFDLTSEKELPLLLNDTFIQRATSRFNDMEQSLAEALGTL